MYRVFVELPLTLHSHNTHNTRHVWNTNQHSLHQYIVKVVSKPSSATVAQDVLFISYCDMFRPMWWPSSGELHKLFKETTIPTTDPLCFSTNLITYVMITIILPLQVSCILRHYEGSTTWIKTNKHQRSKFCNYEMVQNQKSGSYILHSKLTTQQLPTHWKQGFEIPCVCVWGGGVHMHTPVCSCLYACI
jgi:hypothetical protein